MRLEDLSYFESAVMHVLARDGRILLAQGKGFPATHTALARYGLVTLHCPVGAAWWSTLSPAGLRMMGLPVPPPSVVRVT